MTTSFALLVAFSLAPALRAQQASFLGQELSSTGVGVQSAMEPQPYGIAMNASGVIAVADPASNRITRITPDGLPPYYLLNNGGGAGYNWTSVAIDNAGNIYTYAADTMWKIAPDNTITTKDLGFYTLFYDACQSLGATDLAGCVKGAYGEGMAIDPSGNVFLSNDLIGGVIEVPVGGGAPFLVDTDPFIVTPFALATDRFGNLYINDQENSDFGSTDPFGRIVVVPSNGSMAYGIAPPGLNLGGFLGSGVFQGAVVGQLPKLAVDFDGNIYVGGAGRGQVYNNFFRISPDGQSFVRMPTSGNGVMAIGGPDAQNNIAYIENSLNVVRYSLDHVDFGSVPVGTTSSPITLQYAVPAGTQFPLTNLEIYSQGVDPSAGGANPGEFRTTAAPSCNTANPVICSIPVTFTPAAPGPRPGYALPYNNHNPSFPLRLDRTPVVGTGTGANPVFDSTNIVPSVMEVSTTNLGSPAQSVTDGAGYTYAALPYANEVIAISPAGVTSVVNTGIYPLSNPSGVALDGGGNLFIADTGNNRIVGVALITQLELNTAFANDSYPFVLNPLPEVVLNGPTNLATDALGNLYVANTGNNEIDEISFVGYYNDFASIGSRVLATGVQSPRGVAVNAAGDVFFINDFNVEERSAATGTVTQVLTNPQVDAPNGLAVDAGGTLYVADFYNGIVELHTDGSVSRTGGNLYAAQSVSVSALGTITVAGPGAPPGSSGTVLLQVARSLPNLTFANTTVGNTSSDSPQTVTVSNAGNQAVNFTALTYPTDFPESSSATGACTSTSYLSAGNSCTLPITFAPKSAGNLSEAVTFSSNTLTSTGAQQSVPVSGAGNNGGLSQTIAILNRSQVAANICCGIYGSGGPTFYVNSSSGLPVTLKVLSGPMTFNGSLTTTVNTTAGQNAFVSSNDIAAGSGTIQATQAGNSTYAPAAPVQLTYTVSPGNISIRATNPVASGTQFYGGTVQALTYTLSGVLAKDQVHLVVTSGVSGSSPVGNYTVTVALAGLSAPNYNLTTTTLPLTVTQAPLTVAAVDAYQLVGATPGPLTYVLSGFQNGDTASVVTGAPTLATAATSSSAAGAYAITVGAGTLAAANYTFPNLENGELNIFAPINLGAGNLGSQVTQSFSFPAGSAPPASSLEMLTGGSATGAFGSSGFQCTAGAAGSCTANLEFTPTAAGLATGALQLYGGISPANVLISIPVYGIGTGPQVAFTGGAQTVFANNVDNTNGIALDGNGNTYITEWSASTSGAVYELTPDGTLTPIGTGWNHPVSIAVDGSGNVYVADDGLNEVIKLTPVGVQSVVPLTYSSSPEALAFDAGGNLYVTVGGGTVYKVTPGGSETLFYVGSATDGYPLVSSIAFSPTGQMYFADGFNGTIYTAAQGQPATVFSSAIPSAQAIAFDAAGNIYAAASPQNGMGLYELTPTGAVTQLVFEPNWSNPNSLALDTLGNVYIGSAGGQVATYPGQVIKLDRADTPTVNFAAQTYPGTPATADAPITVSVANIGNQPLLFTTPTTGSNPSYPLVFPVNTADGNLCSSATQVIAGASCDLSASFAPQMAGVNTGSIVLTDNALNQTNATQSVALSGTALTVLTITWPTPSAVSYGTALSATQLNAAASIPGKFSYSPAAGTVLPAGTQTLQATFTPTDTTDYPVTTATVGLTVNKVTPALTLVVTPNPVTAGSAVTFKLTLAHAGGGITPTGTVKFYVDYVPLSTVTIVNGVAPVADSVLTAGSHVLVAQYNGDANYKNLNSNADTVRVNQVASTVTITPSANPGVFGSAVTLTATLATKITGIPATGTVNFYAGATLIGGGTLSAGQATLTTSALAAGSNSLTADYLGDANYLAGNSSALTETIGKAAQAITITALPASASLQAPITLTASVATVASGVFATGTVKFYADNVALGTFALTDGSVSTTVSTLALGKHYFVAQYNGDTNYKGGDSATGSATVVKATTTVAGSTSAATSPIGSPVVLTANITQTLTGIPATGTVDFYSGTTLIGAATAAGGQATLTVSTLPAGIATISAHYLGDSHYLPANSPGFTQIISKAVSTFTVTSSANPGTVGSAIVFTATVSETLPGVVPTGTVKVYVDNVLAATVAIVNGSAMYSTSTIAHGLHHVFATYPSDANYAGATSNTLAETVQ